MRNKEDRLEIALKNVEDLRKSVISLTSESLNTKTGKLVTMPLEDYENIERLKKDNEYIESLIEKILNEKRGVVVVNKTYHTFFTSVFKEKLFKELLKWYNLSSNTPNEYQISKVRELVDAMLELAEENKIEETKNETTLDYLGFKDVEEKLEEKIRDQYSDNYKNTIKEKDKRIEFLEKELEQEKKHTIKILQRDASEVEKLKDNLRGMEEKVFLIEDGFCNIFKRNFILAKGLKKELHELYTLIN